MNPFSAHPHEQGITYLAHFVFAMGIALRLLHSVVAFATHAVFPFIGIDRSLDLTATSRFLQEQNDWIEGSKHGVGTLSSAPDQQWG
jgi:hypothetical protein